MYMTFRSMGKEKGRKSVAAVKAKTKRRRLRKKKPPEVTCKSANHTIEF